MDFFGSTMAVYLETMKFTDAQLAYASTALISIAPFMVLFLFPMDNTERYRNRLRLSLSFASGGLLGDAFLHLIPHSMSGHHHHDHHSDHDHHADHNHHHHHSENDHHHNDHGHSHHHQTIVGLYIIAGIIIFFVIEKFVHVVKGSDHHHHHHSHSQQSSTNKKKEKTKQTVDSNKGRNLVSGILNLIADFLHNFTDGLAIGATFAAGKGPQMGIITAVTILLHEIPHEIGDYAILIQSGYQRRSAILLQLVTALGALIGTAVGLHYGTLEHATQFILPITAGGFIYIATVTVIPELLETKKNNHWQTIQEMIALLIGVSMMYWIALNE